MAKKYNHIHKYERKMLGSHTVFKCMLPNCPHYIRKELAEGKFSICWRCNEGFVLDYAALLLKRPHCISCKKLPNNPNFRKKMDTNKTERIDRLKQLLASDNLLKEVK